MAGENLLIAELAAIAAARDNGMSYSVYADEELYGDWYDCSGYH